VSDAERPLSAIGLEADHQLAIDVVLCPLDQSSQFSPGIEHARLHGGGRHSENLRSFTDRLLVIVYEIDDFTMPGRQMGQRLAQYLATVPLLQCDFRVIRRVRDGRLDFLGSQNARTEDRLSTGAR